MPEFAVDLFSEDLPDASAQLVVRFTVERRRLVDYAVVLRVWDEGSWANVRLYDHAHGRPEMHRYTAGGSKMDSEAAPGADVQEGFDAAKAQIRESWIEMIRAWRR